MYRCIRTFDANGSTYWAGKTRVADDHQILTSHGQDFEPDPSAPGAGSRSEIRASDASGDRVVSGEELDLFTRSQLDRIRELAQDPAHREAGSGPREHPGMRRASRDTSPGHESREAGLRALEQMELPAEAGDRLDDLIRHDRAGIDSRYIAAISDPDYERAFWKRIAQPDTAPHSYTPPEAEAIRKVSMVTHERAMAEGTGSTGGFGVPYQLDPSIVLTSDGSQNPLRQLATVSTTTTNVWKGVNSEGVTASFANEATEASDDSPTLAQPSISVEKAQAFVPFSIEVGADYSGLQVELGKLLADARDQLEADRFTYGTAAGTASPEPEGILTGGTITVTTAGTATYAVADVYSLQEAVGPRFQPNSVWLTSNAVKNTTRRFVAQGDTTEPALFSDDQSLLLGRRWNELSTLSSATTSSGAKIAIYGDIARAFRVVDRIGLSIELIPHLFGSSQRPTGQRGLFAYWRVGAAVTNPNALRVLVVR